MGKSSIHGISIGYSVMDLTDLTIKHGYFSNKNMIIIGISSDTHLRIYSGVSEIGGFTRVIHLAYFGVPNFHPLVTGNCSCFFMGKPVSGITRPGKLLHNYGKSPFSMDKSTISTRSFSVAILT